MFLPSSIPALELLELLNPVGKEIINLNNGIWYRRFLSSICCLQCFCKRGNGMKKPSSYYLLSSVTALG